LKGLLIHVGSDGTHADYTLGISGPIFEDQTFEFLPIMERTDTSEKRTYRKMNARNSQKKLSSFIPSEYDDRIVHNDPDLEGFTYGEPVDLKSSVRANVVSKLVSGDYVFFGASLCPYSGEIYAVRTQPSISRHQAKKMAKYVVGYFQVTGLYRGDASKGLKSITTLDGKKVDSKTLHQIEKQITGNAHFKRSDGQFVCVVGKKDRDNILLKRALRLTEDGFPFDPAKLGLEVYDEKRFPRGFKWLEASNTKTLLTKIASSQQS